MSGIDHATPVPHLRGPSVRILSASGATYFAARSVFRYLVTGREITGVGDNATFWHDATVDYRGKPRVRLTRARWRRVARRWALVGMPGVLIGMEGVSSVAGLLPGPPGWATVPWWEILQGYAITGPLAAGVVLAPRARVWWSERELRNDVIYPATRVACSILGQRWDKRSALTMLRLPAGFGQPDEDGEQPSVRLYVPPVPLDKGTKARIVSNVGARLGIPDATGEWQEYGGKAWVQITGADVPPKKVELGMTVRLEDEAASTLRDAIMSATAERPVIGVTAGGRIVRADFDNDSPHLAASGGTGTGKSTLFRELMVQRLRNGSGLLVLDLKGISHSWIYRLGPTRAICVYKIEDIHGAAVALGEELYRRRDEAVKAKQAGLPMPEFRKLDVLVEEANSLIVDLQSYWTNRRAEIKRENKAALVDDEYADVTEPPLRSPAVDALGFGIQMGRELSIHMHYAGQRLSAAAFGGQGGDRRTSFQTRMLARWDRATWKMLVSDVPYRICPSGPRGIWAVVQGENVSVVRVPFLSDDAAVSMVADSPDPGTPVLPTLSGAVSGVRTIEGQAVVQPVRLVALSEAVQAVGLSLNALQIASKRDESFPAPVEIGGPGKPNRYSLADLVEWRDRRDGGRSLAA